jgi:hypothetical protein
MQEDSERSIQQSRTHMVSYLYGNLDVRTKTSEVRRPITD